VPYATAAALPADLRRCGVTAVATSASGGVSLPDLPPSSGPLAVLMGNEAEGLPPEVAAAVDVCVTIPMPPGVTPIRSMPRRPLCSTKCAEATPNPETALTEAAMTPAVDRFSSSPFASESDYGLMSRLLVKYWR
jgi:hypothetical protein